MAALVSLTIESDHSSRDLEMMEDWIRGFPEIAGSVERTRRTIAPSEMGALGDALVLAVSSGGAMGVLRTALKSYFDRPIRSKISMTVTTNDADRPTVVIDSDRE